MKRGRGRSGRKPSNNLNRTLESNGPDVKVRGTAHQICEKYQALARDAHASGDRVAYENYLQHAEHYHRIIAATQQVAQENAAQTRDTDEDDDDAIDVKSNGNVGTSNSNGADSEDDGSEANDGREARDGEGQRRVRRGRRTRPVRGNGKANGAGDDAASGEAESPAETA